MEAIDRRAPATMPRKSPAAGPRERFERDGYLIVEDALSPEAVGALSDAVDRTWCRRRTSPPAGGAAPLHLLAFLGEDEVFIELLDHPKVLPLVVDLLGWNIFVYHCHLDVHPSATEPGPRSWMWHRDGGVQNRDLEAPSPRMSVKVAYFLSDVSEPGRGNFVVVPGSHRGPAPQRPPDDDNDIPGAVPVLAGPGTAVLFDRRLWHMRSENRSGLTRKALFYAYTYRWVRPRDDLNVPSRHASVITPVRAQLLGAGATAIGHWMPGPEDAPVRDVSQVRGSGTAVGRSAYGPGKSL